MTRATFADTLGNNNYQFSLHLALITAGLIYNFLVFKVSHNIDFLFNFKAFPEITISTGCGNSL